MHSLTTRLRRLLPVVTLLAIVPLEYSSAQSGLASLSPGEHVRVTAAPLGPEAHTARVVSASADTLVVRPDDAHGFDVTLPRAEITRLEVSVGRETRRARFAVIGSAIGMAGGMIVGAVTYSDPCESNPAACATWFSHESQRAAVVLDAISGALEGAAVGAIVGQFWTTDRWGPRPPSRQSASLRVTPAWDRGPAVRLAVRVPLR